MIRFCLAGFAGIALVTTSLFAAAQDAKPIEWVVGYAAGGGSDSVARATAETMSRNLERPIVITNKPGAATNIAADYVARSKDYGSVVLTADFATLAVNPFLFSKLSYSAEKDLASVGMLARFPLVLVVGPQVPAKSLKEFMAWAKAQPGGVNYASAGAGSPHHLAGELLREKTGIPMTHVAYRGAAPAMQDILGGSVTRLNKALVDALNSTAVKARFLALGVEGLPGSTADMDRYVKDERERWGRLIKANRIQVD